MVKVRLGLAVELTRMMKNWLFIHEYVGESVSTRLEATRRRQHYIILQSRAHCEDARILPRPMVAAAPICTTSDQPMHARGGEGGRTHLMPTVEKDAKCPSFFHTSGMTANG